jgi:hypothetical protein
MVLVRAGRREGGRAAVFLGRASGVDAGSGAAARP